jgi:hypothetical protein
MEKTVFLSCDQLAERWACSSEHVRSMINGGKLKAMDISTGGKNKRLRIFFESVLEYEEAASVTPAPTRRRKKYKGTHL